MKKPWFPPIFEKWWLEYLISHPAPGTGKARAFLCRLRGHPAGMIWDNPYGWDPDYHCKNCGDDLADPIEHRPGL